MALTREQAIEKAVADLSKRRNVAPGDITVLSQDDAQFPNGVLGAPLDGEISMMMITKGWRLVLQTKTDGERFEYRANPQQVRLFQYQGSNFRI